MDKADFAVRQPRMMGEDRYKKYAVLVPILDTADGRSLLFEKRAGTLRRQPGEICFPGGKLEPSEPPQNCAVRETAEELLIRPDQVTVLGPGDVFVSPFDTIIYPFIGELNTYAFTYNPHEVDEVFTVPVQFFLENPPERYKSMLISRLPGDFPYERIPGGINYPWASGTGEVLFYQYDHRLIWGITAHLIRSATELIDRYNLA